MQLSWEDSSHQHLNLEYYYEAQLGVTGDGSFTSMFASHPKLFSDFDSLGIYPNASGSRPFSLTNIRIYMRTPVLLLDQSEHWHLIILNCSFNAGVGFAVGVPVEKLWGDAVACFARLRKFGLFKVAVTDIPAWKLIPFKVYLYKTTSQAIRPWSSHVEPLYVPHAREYLSITWIKSPVQEQ